MKILIGTGDSWTQGQGGVPQRFFDEWGGRVDKPAHEAEPALLSYELENSWVNVLCRDYMPEYKPYNLGIRGIGNRGAVKQLYYADIPWQEVTDGWLIFMLSGRARFDMLGKHFHNGRNKYDTLHPNKNQVKYNFYFEHFYSKHYESQETMLNILEAQTFAKAHNLKFVFAYSFDNCHDLSKDTTFNLSSKIDWSKCINPDSTYFKVLAGLDGMKDNYGDYFSLPQPLKHVTNCVHPTIEGYKVIAKDIYEKLKAYR